MSAPSMSLGTPQQRQSWDWQLRASCGKSQPMDVDPVLAEHSYEMFQDDAPELLGTAKGPDSPVTAGEDRVLDMPAGFSRAPGDGRPTTESLAGTTSRKNTGRTQ